MNLLLGHDAIVAEWAAERLRCTFAAPFVAIGRVDREGTLVSAAVYTNYTGQNIEFSLYTERCGIARSWWGYVVYGYPFGQLGCLRMTMRTRRANKITRRLLSRFGHFEGVQRRYYGPNKADDAFLFGIFPEDVKRYAR